MYIANFVPFKYAKNIIIPSEYENNSTFALRSLRSIKILEEIEGDTTIGDSQDGELNYVDKEGKMCTFETGNPIMVSCWTKNDTDYVTKEDWMDLFEKGGKDKFARMDGIVIVSTVDKVRKFMEETIAPSFSALHYKDNPVNYPLGPIEQPEDKFSEVSFVKRERYAYQREYRFAFLLPLRCPFEKITFYANPDDYIEWIQFGPEMEREDKKELLDRAFGPVMKKIRDFDELQKDIRDVDEK